MIRWILLFFSILLVTGCFNTKELDTHSAMNEQASLKEKLEKTYTIPIVKENGVTYVLLQDLSQQLNITYLFNETDRTLKLTYNDREFSFIYGVPVYEDGKSYVPAKRNTFSIIDGSPVISTEFLETAFQFKVKKGEGTITVLVHPFLKEVPVIASPEKPTSIDEIMSILSTLYNPIKDAQVSTVSSHLPGAPRSYRNGIHEGIDFYQYGTNVKIDRNTPIYGMGEGVVIRADHDYTPYPSKESRNEDLAIAASVELTPEYILDKLRGRQVWIYYPNGIMARFSHLDRIPETVKVGDTITEETIIGYVGNSGTSGDVNQNDTELHLHLDILIYDELFWTGLSTEEVETVLNHLFKDKESVK